MLDASAIPIQAPPGFNAAEAFGPWFGASLLLLLLLKPAGIQLNRLRKQPG